MFMLCHSISVSPLCGNLAHRYGLYTQTCRRCVLSARRSLSSRHTLSFLSQLQSTLGFAHELVILHAHLPLPGDAPPQYVILLELRDTQENFVSFAAVSWDVTQRFPQRNGCSHPNNIPFHCLANHSFRSIFENLVALRLVQSEIIFYLPFTWWDNGDS